MRENLDINYFIEALSQVDDKEWTLTTDPEPCDAWEWLSHDEGKVLLNIIQPFGLLIEVNDGEGMWNKLAPTPKRRVMKFLNEIKKIKDKKNDIA